MAIAACYISKVQIPLGGAVSGVNTLTLFGYLAKESKDSGL